MNKVDAKKSKARPTTATDDEVIFRTRRHIFGLISHLLIFTLGATGIFAYLSAVTGLVSNFLLFGLLALPAGLILARLYVKVYHDNLLVVTSINIQQVTRKAVFSGKRSVLGLANVEDVTVIRKCIFCYLFDYGTLNIETAGEQDNFLFPYCPQPEKYVKLLMQAREIYLQDNPSQVVR